MRLAEVLFWSIATGVLLLLVGTILTTLAEIIDWVGDKHQQKKHGYRKPRVL